MSFDKRAYQREYMRMKRASDPSYGQPSSTDGYESDFDYSGEIDGEFESPQINVLAILIVVVIFALVLLGIFAYVSFLADKDKTRMEDSTI